MTNGEKEIKGSFYMAYSEKYLKENIRVKCEFLFKDREGQNETKICSLGELDELSSYERSNLVSLVLFPMSKFASARKYPVIENLLENFVKDFPQLRNLAVTSQFTKINIAKLKKNGCPSLARCITLKSTRDTELRDVILTDKKTIHNKTVSDRSSDSNYFCQLIEGDQSVLEDCEIIDVYEFYDMPKEVRAKSAEKEDRSVETITKTFEEKVNEIDSVLQAGGENRLDFTTSERALREIIYGIPREKREEVIKIIDSKNPHISRDALSHTIPNILKEEIPLLFAAPEGYREELVEDLVGIIQNFDEENIGKEELNVLEEELSKIILSEDKLFMAYNIEKLMTESDDELIENINSRIHKSAYSLGDVFTDCYERLGLTNEVAAKVNNVLGTYISTHGKKLQQRVYRAITTAPNIDTIKEIVDKAVAEKHVDLSDKQIETLKNSIVDIVVQKLGTINHLSDDDLYNIGASVKGKLSTLDIDYLYESIKDIKESLSKMVTTESIKECIRDIKDFNDLEVSIHLDLEGLGLVKGNDENPKTEEVEQIAERAVEKKLSKFEKNLVNIVEKAVKKHNLTQDQVRQLISTHFGTLLTDMKQINSVAEKHIIEAITNSTNFVTNEITKNTNNIINTQATNTNNIISNQTTVSNNQSNTNNNNINIANIQQVYENIIKAYVTYNTMAQNMLSAYQTAMVGNATPISNNVGVGGFNMGAFNPLMNPAISNILMLSVLGGGMNPYVQQSMVNTNINQVQQITNLITAIQTVISIIQQGQGMNTPNPVPPAPVPPTPVPPVPGKVVPPAPAPKPPVKPVPVKKVSVPEKSKEFTFKEKSIESLDKLYEPKKKASILKSFARKPVKAVLTAAGLGIAAGVGIGLIGSAATLASGIGLGGILSVAGTIAAEGAVVGAAVGGLSGGVLRGIASGFNFVRRERLYQKFQNKYKKAMNSREVIEIDDAKLLLKEQEKEELRNKLKAATNERQRNRALKAIAKKRKSLNRVKDQKNRHLKKFTTRAMAAADTKEKLNNLEERKDKTTALGGTLQYLRNKRAEVAKGKLTPEDYEDIKSSVNEELSDIFEKDVDVNKMSPEHKTYDAEMSNLISSIDAMKRTSEMNKTLKEIEKRHSKTVLNDVVIEQYDLAEIKAMEREVMNNPSPENIAAYRRVVNDYNRIQQELINKGLSSDPLLPMTNFTMNNVLPTSSVATQNTTQNTAPTNSNNSGKGMQP